MVHPLHGKAAVSGIGETAYTRGTSKSGPALQFEASLKAITDAGLSPRDIDGIRLVRYAMTGYDTSSWFAFFVPAKTPAEIISKMHADTVAALAEPQIRAKLDALGVVVVGSTPEQLGIHLQAEMERWAPVIKAANIKVSE